MTKCFFCNCHIGSTIQVCQEGPYSFSCLYCGNYSLGHGAKDRSETCPDFRAKAAAIAQEIYLSRNRYSYKLVLNQDIHSMNPTDTIFDNIDNIPFLANYPKDYLEIIDRILMNIGRKTLFSPITKFRPSIYEFGLFFVNPKQTYYQEDCSDTQLEKKYRDIESKISATIDILRDHNYISVVCDSDNCIGGWKYSCDLLGNNEGSTSISLAVGGLERIRSLIEDKNQNAEPFLAMWFSNKYSLEFYQKSVDIAAEKAGYNKPCRVDKEKYNGNIILEIINRIKKSRFLIADLTCEHENLNDKNLYWNGIRGGVYYEAGFAAGLGIPVILTCQKACHEKGFVHFDLNQFNMILWEERNGEIYVAGKDEKLENYLKEWIIATVGNGPRKN